MSKERGGVSPTPDVRPESPSPRRKGDGRKALIFSFGAIAFILALKNTVGS